MRMRERVFSRCGSACQPLTPMSQSTSRSEKVSAAKAEARKPARVMAIWMVERNWVGLSTSLSRRRAFLSPSSASWRTLASFSEMRAISAAAKKAFTSINRSTINSCLPK